MKKLNQLTSLVLFVFVAFLVSCEKETTIEEQASAIAQEVADIKEAKEAFLKQNKSINLLTGKPENLQAKGSSTSNYFIDWKNSKKVKFKKGVDILSTPVVRKFVDKREGSFIASFKNGDKIEHRFFMVYRKKGAEDSNSFSGYILKFTIDTKFEALYRYKRGILIAVYVPKKSKFQHRTNGLDCSPAPEEMLDLLRKRGDGGDGGYDGGDVVHLGCVYLVGRLKQATHSSVGGFGRHWHNPSVDAYNSFQRLVQSVINGSGVEESSSSEDDSSSDDSNSSGSSDSDSDDFKDEPEEKIIDSLKGKAECVYNKMVDGKGNINWILENFKDKDNKPSEFNLKLVMSTELPDGVNGKFSENGKEFIIKINANTLSNRTSLEVARTILHEAIHARLREFARRKNSNATNFPGVYNYYRIYGKNWDHQQMADYYRKTIAKGLKKFDNAKHTDEFYEDLAWRGLIAVPDLNRNTGNSKIYTEAWKKLTTTEQDRVKNNMEVEKATGNKNCE